MDKLTGIIAGIKGLDQKAVKAAQAHLDSLTKPPGSLGVLEEVVVKIAGITGETKPQVKYKCLTVFAGDHGICEEGVSAFPAEVTPQMVMNFVHGGAAINALCRQAGAKVEVVDIGVATPVEMEGVTQCNIRRGTRNFAVEPAMTREETLAALNAGAEIALRQVKDGANLLATGEMGIGNTTPSSALLVVFAGIDPEKAIGRGTGVDDAGLERKVAAIKKGLAVNKPDAKDPIGVLAAVGGLEIAGLAGYIIGAAAAGVPVIVDGFISTAAALTAARIAPGCADYMLPSHASEEPGHVLALQALGLEPMLRLKMRLGEGTGAALAMHLVEAACRIQSEMATFADAGVSNKE
jgi:nicotinate-nucleotide--dimethylbenzimidazole phosphoribosyltransferase